MAIQPAPEATPPANQEWRSYYHAAGRRVATPARAPERSAGASVRVQNGAAGTNHLHVLFADHLGSSNVSRRGNGSQTVPQR